jgi:hypothetical protein
MKYWDWKRLENSAQVPGLPLHFYKDEVEATIELLEGEEG